ncbi:nucleotidyltransferase family protein, partial [Candidatus Latescibacterota bacterium]
ESDIDMLVEFMPGETVTFFTLFDMEEKLSSMFGGRKVELRTPRDLSRYFRDRVIAEAEVQFARK